MAFRVWGSGVCGTLSMMAGVPAVPDACLFLPDETGFC
jgi:hypothetical protein